MVTTADAIMGGWDGSGNIPDHVPSRWEQFAQLDPVWQMTVLEHDLAPLLEVKAPAPDASPRDGMTLAVYSKQLDSNILELKSPSFQCFNNQLSQVRAHADLRGERAGEIADQLADVLPYFAMIGPLDGERHRWTVLLLALIQRITSRIVQRMKLAYHCPRPVQYSQNVLPVIGTPTHGTFPSCHAGLVFSLATVLESLASSSSTSTPVTRYSGNDTAMRSYVLEARAFRLAERIAENRVVAGVHFPIDNQFGALIGTCVAEYLLTSFSKSHDTEVQTWKIDASDHSNQTPFRLMEYVTTLESNCRTPLKIPCENTLGSFLLIELLEKAREEWQFNSSNC